METKKQSNLKKAVYLKSVEQYRLIKEIGIGAYGKVFYAIDVNTNQELAMKAVEKKTLKDGKMIQCFQKEIDIMSKLNHINIIKYIDLKITANNYYIVMEFCSGYSLRSLVNYYTKNPNIDNKYKETQIQHIIFQLCSALRYIYDCNIIHRDIKLENVLLHYDNYKDKENFNVLNSVVKLIDFGFSRRLDKGEVSSTICGSPLNMAPQILNNLYNEIGEDLKYDYKADLWSLGSLVFELLVGKPPFDCQNLDDLKKKVKIGSYQLPNKLKVSKEIISFLCGLLQEDPNERMEFEEILEHDFLTKNSEEFNFFDLNKAASTQLKINEKDFMKLLFQDDEINKIKADKGTYIRSKKPIGNDTLFNQNFNQKYLNRDDENNQPNFERNEIKNEDNKIGNDTICNKNLNINIKLKEPQNVNKGEIHPEYDISEEINKDLKPSVPSQCSNLIKNHEDVNNYNKNLLKNDDINQVKNIDQNQIVERKDKIDESNNITTNLNNMNVEKNKYFWNKQEQFDSYNKKETKDQEYYSYGKFDRMNEERKNEEELNREKISSQLNIESTNIKIEDLSDKKSKDVEKSTISKVNKNNFQLIKDKKLHEENTNTIKDSIKYNKQKEEQKISNKKKDDSSSNQHLINKDLSKKVGDPIHVNNNYSKIDIKSFPVARDLKPMDKLETPNCPEINQTQQNSESNKVESKDIQKVEVKFEELIDLYNEMNKNFDYQIQTTMFLGAAYTKTPESLTSKYSFFK